MRQVALDVHQTFCEVAIREGGKTYSAGRVATAGYADVVAPPMFAVVYSTPAVVMAVFDPDVAMNFAMEVHGAQEFRWGPLVVAGDEIMKVATAQSGEGRL